MEEAKSFIDKIQEPVLVVSKGDAIIKDVNAYGEPLFGAIVGDGFFDSISKVDSLLSGALCRYEDQNYTLKIVEFEEYDLYFVTEFVPRSDLDRLGKELSALMVHVFRSPLSGVMGFAELLMSVGTETQKKYASTIDAGLKKLAAILDDIESFAQEREAHFSEFNADALIVDILLDFSSAEQELIDVKIDKHNKIIKSDYLILRTIIVELLSNALQFSNAREKHIQLRYKSNGTFSVRSFAEPLSEKNVRRLFLPFYSTKASNTGLGLTRAAFYAHVIHSDIIISENSKKGGLCFEIGV